MTDLDERLSRFIDERKSKGRFRKLREYDTSANSSLIDFSSNDYLSLTSSPALRQAYLARLAESPQVLGSTGSRLLSGGTPAHHVLEDRFASFFNSPSALLFNSGWDANVSFFSTAPQHDDWVVYDELVHASVHSGLRSSRVKQERRLAFKHNDPSSLSDVLRAIQYPAGGTVFLALESLYSMDGDFAPLSQLLDVLDSHVPPSKQCVVLDEAHSTGVYGVSGRGIVRALGEEGRVAVRLMTFGKAVGCSGAVLLCSPTIRTFLINFARPLIFSTALPHSTLISLSCAFDLLESAEGERRRLALFTLSRYLDSLLAPLLAETPRSVLSLPPTSPTPFPQSTCPSLPPCPPSPILGLITPTPHALSAYLLERGFIVRPVVPPTVPPGMERVRICLRADMGTEVLDSFVEGIREWVKTSREQSERTVSSNQNTSMIQKRPRIEVKAKL
ncbi:putative 8-amino-7-oxononanoatesynthase [Naematelia encephala]|uniref:Putative 8-amino-7-oxononanoatesynthase n=1 Tax=Naematelia encephala TaxID=71784 RepID=A0A1Y2BIY5_9TREE|nr:putative 8-amino-7-oxononanoatesynthase [Naematelia encephala]